MNELFSMKKEKNNKLEKKKIINNKLMNKFMLWKLLKKINETVVRGYKWTKDRKKSKKNLSDTQGKIDRVGLWNNLKNKS